MNEFTAKGNEINEMADRLEAMSIRELMIRVKALVDKVTTTSGFKRMDSSTDSIA